MSNAREAGFTILEVLVALVILIMGLTSFYQSFGVGMLASMSAARERHVAETAENVFAALGRTDPLADGLTRGEGHDGQRWTLRLEPFPSTREGDAHPLALGHVATLDVFADGRATVPYRFQTLVIGAAK
jgi:general secretion pathway protein I